MSQISGNFLLVIAKYNHLKLSKSFLLGIQRRHTSLPHLYLYLNQNKLWKNSLRLKYILGKQYFYPILLIFVELKECAVKFLFFFFLIIRKFSFPLFIFFFDFYLFIYFFFVVNFVIHWNEKALGSHVFPIPIPPPSQ